MKRLTLAFIAATLLTAGSLPSLKYRALDNSGNAISGALLCFFETGTTTATATYSDEALTSANANPVVADSSGYFGEIYMQTDQTYRVRLLDNDGDGSCTGGGVGTTIWSLDGINAAKLTSETINTRLKQIASNPLDYRSSVGDGAADEYLAVQDAIDNRDDLVVDLLGHTFRCDSAITLNSNIVLRNGTLDFSNSTANAFITITGSQGSTTTLTSNGDPGDVQIVVTSASGIAAGDWLYVTSSATWATGVYSGEIVQVESVSGTTLQLTDSLEGEYLVANTATARELTPVSNVKLQDLTIIASPSQSGTGRVIYGQYVEKLVVDNVLFEGIKDAGIELEGSWDATIRNSTFDNDNGSGTGIAISNRTRSVDIHGNKFRRLDTGVEAGQEPTDDFGIVRWVNIHGNEFHGNEYGVRSLVGTQYTTIRNNNFVSDLTASSNGVTSSGVDTIIEGNTFRLGVFGIQYDNGATAVTGRKHRAKINNNYFSGTADSCIYVTNTTAIDGMQINGNHCHTGSVATTHGIEVYFDANANNVSIDGNYITDPGGSGNCIDVEVNDDTVTNLSVSNNTMEFTSTNNGINVDVVTGTYDNVSIVGNTIDGQGTGENGIYVVDADNLSIVGNTVMDIDGAGIWVDTDDAGSSVLNVSIVGNGVYIDGDSAIGIYILSFAGGAGVSDVSITGNVVEGMAVGGYCLALENLVKNVTITGNSFLRDDDTQDSIGLLGNAAGAVDYVIISGNNMKNGAYGIGESSDANNTNVFVYGNIFNSMNSGDVEFAVTTTFHDLDITNVGDINVDTVSADGSTVDYLNMDKLQINAAPANLDATCTAYTWRIDNNATVEMCYCQATNTWYCWTIDSTSGPAD